MNTVKEEVVGLKNSNNHTEIPEINLNRVKHLTMSRIKRNKMITFKNRFTKIACAIAAAFVITTGGVAYALNAEGIQNILSKITGIQQSKILTVGKTISNNDYELKVHEIVTDSSLGYIVVSIEALGDKSKKNFDSYQFSTYDIRTVGSAYGVSELRDLRKPYIKYYKIGLQGVSKLQEYIQNDGILRFSLNGMDTPIEVSLSPTVDRIDMDIAEDTTSGFQYQFNKLYVSELGLSFEATDTRTDMQEYDYKIELLFNDGTKELLLQEKNHSYEHGDLLQTRSGNIRSDYNGTYADKFILFSKILPLDTIKQVIINDIAFDIEK